MYVCLSENDSDSLSVFFTFWLDFTRKNFISSANKQTTHKKYVHVYIHATFLHSVYSCCRESRGIFYTEKNACLLTKEKMRMYEGISNKKSNTFCLAWLDLS